MYYNYDAYKKARDTAWKTLIECNVNCLPVPLADICTFYNAKILLNSDLSTNKLGSGEKGKTVFVNSQYFIIVDDSNSVPVQRYTIAHEIGHICLNHFNNQIQDRDREEYEAERFAIDLLAPACVLWGINLHTADEIAVACNISLQSSKIREECMKVLYERDKFLTSPLERQVSNQFKDFSEKTNNFK